MSELKPTDVWGDVLYSDQTEEEATWYEDGWEDGYEAGRLAALVEACGVVTALFVAEVDEEREDG